MHPREGKRSLAQPSPKTSSHPAAGPGEPPPEGPALRVLSGGALRLGLLDRSLGFHLRLAQEASFAAFARRAGRSELRPGHFAALVVIEAHPGLSQTALGGAIGRDKSTLTPTLRELERRGLLRRERAAGDRRSYALMLTEAGREALATLTRSAAAHEEALDALVGDGDRAAFLATLRRLIAGLEGEAR